MSHRALARVVLAVLPSAFAGCGADEPSVATALAPRLAPPDSLEELARWFQDAQKARDEKRLGELGASVTPTAAELRGLMRAGEATEAFLKDYSAKGPVDWKADSASAKQLAVGLFSRVDPKRTEVKAHSATTAEILADAKGTPAGEEFPGGMERSAAKVAAPGSVWWVVECLEPGHGDGTKFSCFTRLGDRWIFVAKPWRSIPREKNDAPEMPDPK